MYDTSRVVAVTKKLHQRGRAFVGVLPRQDHSLGANSRFLRSYECPMGLDIETLALRYVGVSDFAENRIIEHGLPGTSKARDDKRECWPVQGERQHRLDPNLVAGSIGRRRIDPGLETQPALPDPIPVLVHGLPFGTAFVSVADMAEIPPPILGQPTAHADGDDVSYLEWSVALG